MICRIRIAACTLAFVLLATAGSAVAAGQAATPAPELAFTVGYVQSNLVKGETTRADVIAAFGNPTHQTVRATDSGSSEVLYYQKGGQQQASTGGGVAKATRGIGNIAGGLAPMFGNNSGASQAANVSYQANNVASGMEMLAGPDGANAAAGQNGPATLTIQLQDGIVSSYSLE